jgi:hypothetical protein
MNSELDRVIDAGEKAQASLTKVVYFLKAARPYGKGDYWLGFELFEFMKYWHLLRAYLNKRKAREDLEVFQNELERFGIRHKAELDVEVSPGIVLVDLIEDFLGDLLMLDTIDKLRIKGNIAISRVRRIVRLLKKFRDGE